MFFSNFGDATAWLFASEWDHWEQNHVPMCDRPKFLSEHVNLEVKDIDVFKMHPAAIASQLRSGNVSLPVMGRPVESRVKSQERDQVAMASGLIPKDAFNLKGGKGFRSLPSQPKEDDLEGSGLWWWRCLNSPEGKQDLNLFLRQWERNAFFYEFRARIRSLTVYPEWEAFCCPWGGLDTTQKVILYYFCPPRGYVPESRWMFHHDHSRFLVEVDFARPLDAVLSDVKTRWEMFEPELTHLWGIAEGYQPAGPSAHALTLPPRWALLEALDRRHYLGLKLLNCEHTLLRRQMDLYKTDCEEAGITP
ncbi:hypothetical protein [Brevifollis gellanilyticus]|uniref:hypothetical protein n=1 Tax=Brevifollis gellanilyticus TaxID=748831 RepID=UPI0011BE610E|nr:hypothetical protein [Brevifollis gellanilyticus]